LPFYSPEFVIDATVVTQEHGMSKPTGIQTPVFVKVCEQCGCIVVVEDVHDRWHLKIIRTVRDSTIAVIEKNRELNSNADSGETPG
jgi:hypothetical protein